MLTWCSKNKIGWIGNNKFVKKAKKKKFNVPENICLRLRKAIELVQRFEGERSLLNLRVGKY